MKKKKENKSLRGRQLFRVYLPCGFGPDVERNKGLRARHSDQEQNRGTIYWWLLRAVILLKSYSISSIKAGKNIDGYKIRQHALTESLWVQCFRSPAGTSQCIWVGVKDWTATSVTQSFLYPFITPSQQPLWAYDRQNSFGSWKHIPVYQLPAVCTSCTQILQVQLNSGLGDLGESTMEAN